MTGIGRLIRGVAGGESFDLRGRSIGRRPLGISISAYALAHVTGKEREVSIVRLLGPREDRLEVRVRMPQRKRLAQPVMGGKQLRPGRLQLRVQVPIVNRHDRAR